MRTYFQNIDEYILTQPENFRPDLELIRQTIKNTVPDAVEVISYGMPAFKFHGILAYFAVHEKHYGLYVAPEVLPVFRARLKSYKTSKATIQFPFNTPLPVELIIEIISYAALLLLEKKELKKGRKKV